MKTYKDIYKFPLHDCFISDDGFRSGQIFDSANNFVFQFEDISDENQEKVLNVLNGVETLKNDNLFFNHREGCIMMNNNNILETKIILIRGWGNLTGIGAHHLPPEEAANIQDSFAEFIVEQLNKR